MSAPPTHPTTQTRQGLPLYSTLPPALARSPTPQFPLYPSPQSQTLDPSKSRRICRNYRNPYLTRNRRRFLQVTKSLRIVRWMPPSRRKHRQNQSCRSFRRRKHQSQALTPTPWRHQLRIGHQNRHPTPAKSPPKHRLAATLQRQTPVQLRQQLPASCSPLPLSP